MKTQDRRAPEYADLRPLKPLRSSEFPVYPDLVERMVRARDHPDPTIAHVLATCSGYAYSDAGTVAMIMARLGFEDNACRMVEQHVDAMMIETTTHLLQSADGRVVIACYRGTVPTGAISWLNDLDINPERVQIELGRTGRSYEVHGGFYRNVRATRPEVVAALQRALEGTSVLESGEPVPHAMEALYLTGHSFGAAMASLLAIMLCTEPAYASLGAKLRAAYTFGGPMIGSPQLASDCRQQALLGKRVIRYVYDNDIVPQLPPTAAGDFAHFGVEYQYRPSSGWQRTNRDRGQLRTILEVVAAPLTFLARQAKLTHDIRFRASLYDHFPAGYITALTPPDKTTEFGE